MDIPINAKWCNSAQIVSLDPWGHRIAEDFAPEIATGLDIRPTIAVTRARLSVPELNVPGNWSLKADGKIVRESRTSPSRRQPSILWYLPGIAERFGVGEDKLRRTLFEQTGGMYPELVTRPDLTASSTDRRDHGLYLW